MFESPYPDYKEWNHYWSRIVDSIDRDKVKPSHIKQMQLLCDLYIEYDQLSETLEQEGYLVTNITSQGETHKINPLYNAKDRTVKSIMQLTKSLGIELYTSKDDTPTEDQENEWL